MAKVIYQITDFCFSYPLAKHQINFAGDLTIYQNQHLLLTGSSGSGKSTLLLALKGLIPNYINGTYSGKILFNQQDIQHVAANELLSIGYLQQNPDHQIIYQTVIDELAFALENLSLAPEVIIAKIHSYAELFQITHLLQRNIATLSGGEKQKINLMAILITEPQVLLLDEPTAFLDPESAHQIIQILKQHAQSKTVIIIDHNQHFYQNFVTKIVNVSVDSGFVEQNLSSNNWHDNYPNVAALKSSTEIILQIENLNFTHEKSKSKLFNNLNFSLTKGEIVVINGKNGAGKSTLFKLIAKLIKSEGIYFNGTNINQIKNTDYWKQIGMLWQNPENHFLFNSVTEELKNSPQLVEKFALVQQSRNNPYCLSEGQKRRLSLAIALTKPSQLLLLDEPTFGQDLANKIILRDTINQLASQGYSFIIISHDVEFSQSIAHTQYLLSGGKLCQN